MASFTRAAWTPAFLVLAAHVLLVPVARGDACSDVVGDWSWFIGGRVSFASDHHAKWTPDTPSLPAASADWKCDTDSGSIVVTWQNGFVDTLQLSENGNVLTGTSSTGVAVSGERYVSATNNAQLEKACRASPATPGQGACEVVTARDICQAMGEPYQEGEFRQAGETGDICHFRPVDGMGDIVEVWVSRGFDFHPGYYHIREQHPEAKEEVPGVGENAYVISDWVNRKVTLHALMPVNMIDVDIKGMRSSNRGWSHDGKFRQLTTIAKTAVERTHDQPQEAGPLRVLWDKLHPKPGGNPGK